MSVERLREFSMKHEGIEGPRPVLPRIINTWDQMVEYGGDRIAVTFHQNGGRSVPWWAVLHIVAGRQRPTDLKASQWANRNKVFAYASGKEAKAQALAKALAWVQREYGRKGLVRNAMGDFVEAEVQAKYPIKRAPRKAATV